jgi:hypothetical protein
MFSVQNVINTMVTSTTNILNSSAQNCLTSATNNSIIKISCDPTLRARSPGLANSIRLLFQETLGNNIRI